MSKSGNQKNNLKIIFMGTPDFALSILKSVCEAGYNVVLAVTQPDKPAGRGKKMQITPVKDYALSAGIEVYSPDTLKTEEAVEKLKAYEPDVILVAAYGKILPDSVLEIPKHGCINVHASLLPKYRGAAPINRAIQYGETTGGVSMMYMASGIDNGDIISQKTVTITPDMCAGEYHDILAACGGEAAVETLEAVQSGTIKTEKQNPEEVTYAEKINKSELCINFNESNTRVYNLIRAMSPYPCAYFMFNSKRLQVIKAERGNASGVPGEVLSFTKDGIEIACLNDSIILKTIKPEGKRAMSVSEFYAGNK